MRDSNPQRDVVVGRAEMNTIAGLTGLELPDDDRLIVGIHYYLPLPLPTRARTGCRTPPAGWAHGGAHRSSETTYAALQSSILAWGRTNIDQVLAARDAYDDRSAVTRAS